MDETNDSKILPALPESDEESISGNRFNSFYKVGSRDFWDKNVIVREKLKPFPTCDHYFISTDQGAECQKCHFILYGIEKVSEGKVYHKGEPIKI